MLLHTSQALNNLNQQPHHRPNHIEEFPYIQNLPANHRLLHTEVDAPCSKSPGQSHQHHIGTTVYKCKFCPIFTSDPLKVHIAICCPKFNTWRRRILKLMHSELTEIYQDGSGIHSQQTAQEILRILSKWIVTNPICITEKDRLDLWSILCGANASEITRKPYLNIRSYILYYRRRHSKLKQENKFWILLRLWAAKYISSLEKMWKTPGTIAKRVIDDQYIQPGIYIGTIQTQGLHWNIQNEAQRREYFRTNNINAKDWVIISTDGSRKVTRGKGATGIGIHIHYRGRCWGYAQALGNQPIDYAELYAILQSFRLLERLKDKIPFQKLRICLMTDSEICFNHFFGNRLTSSYDPMIEELRAQVRQTRTTLLKVPSHEDKYNRATIPGNDEADRYADIGRRYSEMTECNYMDEYQLPNSCIEYQCSPNLQTYHHFKYDTCATLWPAIL